MTVAPTDVKEKLDEELLIRLAHTVVDPTTTQDHSLTADPTSTQLLIHKQSTPNCKPYKHTVVGHTNAQYSSSWDVAANFTIKLPSA